LVSTRFAPFKKQPENLFQAAFALSGCLDLCGSLKTVSPRKPSAAAALNCFMRQAQIKRLRRRGKTATIAGYKNCLGRIRAAALFSGRLRPFPLSGEPI
jgi:lipoprotein